MKQGPIHKLHQPIPPMAGALGFGAIIALTELITFLAQG
jgi:hypothetical protein